MKRIVCALMVAVGVACGSTEAKQRGEALADQYFAAAQEGNTASILKMYDDAFYKVTPEAKWKDIYDRVRTKLGRPQAHTLSNWNVNSFAGTSESGHYVTLVYQ